MNLQQYIHQVLIEENPFINVPDVQSRFIFYESVSVNIDLDIKDVQYNNSITHDKVLDIIKEELHREFGNDLDSTKVNRVCYRIVPMIVSDETRQGF